MGKADKALNEFIESIPFEKLKGIPDTAGTLDKDQNFRLDMREVN